MLELSKVHTEKAHKYIYDTLKMQNFNKSLKDDVKVDSIKE